MFGSKREHKIPDGPGPGHYKHERADDLVNNRNPAYDFGNNQGRVQPVVDPSNGPGTYDNGRKFGDNAESHVFGSKREHRIPDGPGPGYYLHERADDLVEKRNPAYDFGSYQGRPTTFADPSNGPGTYDDGRKFGDDAESHVFGTKREHKIPDGPGPGYY